MAGRQPAGLSISSGRRGFFRYLYGTHYWIPETQADWSRGIIRDAARDALPPGSVYDSADYLLHQPGVAQKRGGTTYAGPALTGSPTCDGVVYAAFPAGSQLIGLGLVTGAEHLFKVTAGATTDLGAMTYTNPLSEKPKVRSGGGTSKLIVCSGAGALPPVKYDGTTIGVLGGSPPNARYSEVYKSRLVLANNTANPNRVFFSPTPDIEATWDTANSWIDVDASTISGLAALNNVLLVFSPNGIERIIGSTPPPNTDMDRAPLSAIGCTDARSITVREGVVYFANPQGIYMTNGASPVSLTDEGGISSYWAGLFTGYDPTTWSIATGIYRTFLFVCVLDNSAALVTSLMCNVPKRAWWRTTNMRATMFTSAIGASEELYYANRDTNRVTALSQIFTPAAGNKNDANGTAVTPAIEFAPFGEGTGVKSFGFGHLDFDMRDAGSDNPTMAVTVKTGVQADTSTTPAESPLVETTTVARPRFLIGKDAQSCTVALAQTNASAKTEIYAVEVESRSQPLTGEGVS